MTSNTRPGDAMLAAYRRQRGLDPARHARLFDRLQASLDGDAAGAGSAPPVARSPARRFHMGWLVAAALAAGVVLGVTAAPLAATLMQGSRGPTHAADVEATRSAEHEFETRDDAALATHAAEVPAPADLVTPSAPVPATMPMRHGPGRARRPTAMHEPSVDTDQLVLEIALVRRARRALHGGDVEGALAILDQHAEQFPSGQMLEERATLRIEALCVAGKQNQARAEAHRVRARFPGAVAASDADVCAGD